MSRIESRHDLFNCELVPSRVRGNRKLRLTAVSHIARGAGLSGSVRGKTSPKMKNVLAKCKHQNSAKTTHIACTIVHTPQKARDRLPGVRNTLC